MTALLIIAHGSKLESSNEEISLLAKNITKNFNDYYTSYAFLEFASPSFEEELNNLVKKGFHKIKVLPYFLAKGKHVKNDIPKIIKDFKTNNIDTKIEVLPHLGNFKGIEKLIISNIK